jgi:hypothetical protein
MIGGHIVAVPNEKSGQLTPSQVINKIKEKIGTQKVDRLYILGSMETQNFDTKNILNEVQADYEDLPLACGVYFDCENTESIDITNVNIAVPSFPDKEKSQPCFFKLANGDERHQQLNSTFEYFSLEEAKELITWKKLPPKQWEFSFKPLQGCPKPS